MKHNAIKIEKFITQYDKNKEIQTTRIAVTYVPTLEAAIAEIKNADLHFVKNEKGISLFESIKATIWEKYDNIKVLFKEYNFNTLQIWDNLGNYENR